MKSTLRCDHGRLGMATGWSLPDGRWRGLLDMVQFVHPFTYLLTSEAMLGNQKRSLSNKRVSLTPG